VSFIQLPLMLRNHWLCISNGIWPTQIPSCQILPPLVQRVTPVGQKPQNKIVLVHSVGKKN